MLPDWLTAPSVAGTGRNALWIPSDGRERFFLFFFYPLFVSHKHAHTKQCDIIAQNPEFQMGRAQGKSPKSSLKSGSEPNPQLRGDPIWVTARSGYQPSLYSSLPSLSLSISLSPFLPFFSLFLQLALSNFGQLFHTVKKKGGGGSSSNFANNASVCASAMSEWLAQQKPSLLWWQAHMVSVCTSKH